MFPLGGCSGHPEQPLLEQFFAASRLRDKTALQSIATVIFEPREDGIVTAFDITGVAEEEGGPGEVTKIVTLQAPVKLASGQVVRKTLVLTMERRTGSWLVTGIAATAR